MISRKILYVSFFGLWLLLNDADKVLSQIDSMTGRWRGALASPGGPIQFGLEIIENAGQRTAFLINGEERIEIPTVEATDDWIRLSIAHFDSELSIKADQDGKRLSGIWKKRVAKTKSVEMRFSATREIDRATDSPDEFLGRWSVKFESSEDPAVAIFQVDRSTQRVHGTFLTTTGDYRFLDGYVVDGQLSLSCFDGSHAFLFKGRRDDRGRIVGDFWSSNTWHESWVAIRNVNAKLPNAFAQTKISDQAELQKLTFPGLDGQPRRLDDPIFAGKARIIYVFGSWCPNCHDAAAYFADLEDRFGERGLSILGLAFELTGEFERDSRQVQRYLDRHGATYPVLIAGLADKAKASQALPLLDRVRSYPTTIFVDSKGQIRGVHTGFAGPATGQEYANLKQKFEELIEQMLAE